MRESRLAVALSPPVTEHVDEILKVVQCLVPVGNAPSCDVVLAKDESRTVGVARPGWSRVTAQRARGDAQRRARANVASMSFELHCD